MDSETISTLIRDYIELSLFTRSEIHQTVDQITHDYQITFEQFCLLRMAAQMPGISPVQIAERLNINKSGISIRIGRLLEKGYIEKRNIDKRSFGLYDTEKGLVIYQEGEKQIHAQVADWIRELGEADSKEFIRIYKKINTIISRLKGEKK